MQVVRDVDVAELDVRATVRVRLAEVAAVLAKKHAKDPGLNELPKRTETPSKLETLMRADIGPSTRVSEHRDGTQVSVHLYDVVGRS